jgi:hypothetical protein
MFFDGFHKLIGLNCVDMIGKTPGSVNIIFLLIVTFIIIRMTSLYLAYAKTNQSKLVNSQKY